jgi:hypothetical protein
VDVQEPPRDEDEETEPAREQMVAEDVLEAIREVAPDGTISTVVNAAGANGAIPASGGESSGKAPAASHLYNPYAVTVDPSTGTLYIADTHNNAIAEVLGVAKS